MTPATVDHDDLVRRAENLVSLLKASKWNRGVGNTQAAKVVEVAQNAPSLGLLINWLRYQAAREGDRQPFWRVQLGQGKRSLAEALAHELNEVQKQYAPDHMAAVRLFLGYFRRALVGVEFLDLITMEE